MHFGDTVNGIFEAFGALFTWGNAWRIYQDKDVKGIYWPFTAFFSAWGIWNLYYYPSLGQWLSFVGGCFLVAGNITWFAMALYYMRIRRR